MTACGEEEGHARAIHALSGWGLWGRKPRWGGSLRVVGRGVWEEVLALGDEITGVVAGAGVGQGWLVWVVQRWWVGGS